MSVLSLSKSDFLLSHKLSLLNTWFTTEKIQVSADDLKKIKPLKPSAAKRVSNECATQVFGKYGGLENFFHCSATFFDTALKPASVRVWLDTVLPEMPDELVFIWSFEQVAIIKRELFIRKWDVFCCPENGNTTIWQPEVGYVLYYDSDELFTIKAVNPNCFKPAL